MTQVNGKRLKSIHAGNALIDVISNLKINQSMVARAIGVNARVINEICNEKRNVSPEMAVKLGALFLKVGLNANFWSRLQAQYDIEQANSKVKVSDIKPLEIAV